MTKQVTAIKKEFGAALAKAVKAAIVKTEKLPKDKKTTKAAYDVIGGIGSMLDMAPNFPKDLMDRLVKLEQAHEDILHPE